MNIPEIEARLEKIQPKKTRSHAAVLEGLLWTFSATALTLALWILGEGALFQMQARDLLSPAALEELEGTKPGRLSIALGTPIAKLEIPRLKISVAVTEGTTPKALRQAVGHIPSSARPGEPGNVALAGHRDTFFLPLKEIRVGDRILLESSTGSDAYRVQWMDVVAPSDLSVIGPTEDSVLTLVTCYPFRWLGPAPQRFIVRARQEG